MKLREWDFDSLPALGSPIGVVVNYSPDRAVHYMTLMAMRLILKGAY